MSNQLCALIKPLQRRSGAKPLTGRLRFPGQQALCYIVLHADIKLEYLPQKPFSGRNVA